MLKECFDNVRKSVPLVHNITNYVTVNDVANIILACGASPIMSDEPDDVTDITSICSSLNINIGTLHKSSIEAMYLAGKRANELGHPILLDPVGAGASALRTNTAVGLMAQQRVLTLMLLIKSQMIPWMRLFYLLKNSLRKAKQLSLLPVLLILSAMVHAAT